MIPVQR
jgi:hypothetical protein